MPFNWTSNRLYRRGQHPGGYTSGGRKADHLFAGRGDGFAPTGVIAPHGVYITDERRNSNTIERQNSKTAANTCLYIKSHAKTAENACLYIERHANISQTACLSIERHAKIHVFL